MIGSVLSFFPPFVLLYKLQVSVTSSLTYTFFFRRLVYVSHLLYRSHCILLILFFLPFLEHFPIFLLRCRVKPHLCTIYQFTDCLDVFSVSSFAPFLQVLSFTLQRLYFFTEKEDIFHKEDICMQLSVITVAITEGCSILNVKLGLFLPMCTPLHLAFLDSIFHFLPKTFLIVVLLSLPTPL